MLYKVFDLCYFICMPKIKITEKGLKVLCDAIALGMSVEGACASISINKTTYYRYLNDGERYNDMDESELNDEQKKVRNVYNAVKKAQNDFEDRNLKVIQKASNTDWKASAWLLERRKPAVYALHNVNDNTNDDRITIVNDVPRVRKK